MDLLLPDMKDEHLQEMVVCAWVHCDGHPETFEKVQVQSRYPTANGFGWARLLLEPDDDHGHAHLHFNICREDDCREVRSIPAVEASELGHLINRFSGRTANIALMGRYCADFGELSERGMICGLRGVSTESCGAQLVLDGASMSIVDHDFFTRLKWDYADDDDAVIVRLWAEIECSIEPRYLIDAVELMRNGLDCFVLETGQQPHAESSGPDLQEIATA
jgi:hypothetical protein